MSIEATLGASASACISSPLDGQTKAAADQLAASVPRHYIVRTSWVVGDGNNFVQTMTKLADNGTEPSVIDDQIGRLTFADDIAKGIGHLLRVDAAPGIYNLTSTGGEQSWARIAQRIFTLRGRRADAVIPVTTRTYSTGKDLAPRPMNSLLDLTKIRKTCFSPADGTEALDAYLASRTAVPKPDRI